MQFEWRDFVWGGLLGLLMACLNTAFWHWMYPDVPNNPVVVALLALMNFTIMQLGLGIACMWRQSRKK